MLDIVHKYFEYINNEEFDRLLELWHDDCELTFPMQGTMKGKDAIRKFFEALPETYSQHRDTVIDCLLQDNRAATWVSVDNTTPDGKRVKFEAMDWIVFEEGKIKSITAIFDMHQILKILKS